MEVVTNKEGCRRGIEGGRKGVREREGKREEKGDREVGEIEECPMRERDGLE